jgi:hypothetical protein
MGSLLAQDYPALEVVAVDDRSRDGTGEILDRLAARAPALRVVHVAELPEGWLGKNHACHLGFRATRGALVLFTDGDVSFAPGALRAAAAYLLAHRLGHLVALPRLETGGGLERAFVSAFAALIGYLFRVADLRRPGTEAFVGVGAFNLVRREGYLAAGGHERLRLEVADDVKLGLLLRRSGVAQGAADGGGRVRVRWQAGLLASLGGLVKNAFAGLEYRWDLTLGLCALLALLGAGPLAALLGPPPARAPRPRRRGRPPRGGGAALLRGHRPGGAPRAPVRPRPRRCLPGERRGHHRARRGGVARHALPAPGAAGRLPARGQPPPGPRSGLGLMVGSAP